MLQVMKGNGLHGDDLEHDSASGVMSDVKVVREGLVMKVLHRFWKGNHVPFHTNVFFNGTISASSRPRIPAHYAEACLLKQTVEHVVVENVLRLRRNASSVAGTTENRLGTSLSHQETHQCKAKTSYSPNSSKPERISSSGRGKVIRSGTIPF